jgi:hypothetical protein
VICSRLSPDCNSRRLTFSIVPVTFSAMSLHSVSKGSGRAADSPDGPHLSRNNADETCRGLLWRRVATFSSALLRLSPVGLPYIGPDCPNLSPVGLTYISRWRKPPGQKVSAIPPAGATLTSLWVPPHRGSKHLVIGSGGLRHRLISAGPSALQFMDSLFPRPRHSLP